jgi:CrcB protein
MVQLLNLLLIGLGGCFGACLRFLVSGAFPSVKGLPVGTLIVNTTGSFMLAFLTYSAIGVEIVYPITAGVLGSFTTFSTFAYESFYLLEDGSVRLSLTKIMLNIASGFAGAVLGRALATLI